MGTGDETRLEGRRRQVDALVQHAVKEGHEARLIAGHDLAEVADGVLGGEEHAEHAAHLVARERDTGGARARDEPCAQVLGGGAETREETGLLHEAQIGESCSHGHRIA